MVFRILMKIGMILVAISYAVVVGGFLVGALYYAVNIYFGKIIAIVLSVLMGVPLLTLLIKLMSGLVKDI